jgi:hypothetical protein
MYSAVARFVYVSRSMRLHQGHHTAPTSKQLFEEAADLVFTVDEVAFENPMTQSTLPLEV